MHAIRKFGLLTALRALQASEYFLEGLLPMRAYLPLALLSLAGGFAIGFFLLPR